MAYDFVLKNGHVVDPVNGINGIFDIAVENGRIASVESGIPGTKAGAVYDMTGRYVIPGIVDMHSHATSGISPYSHRMLAMAGVTATLEMAGPIEEVLEDARDKGAGLTMASIEQIVAGHNVPTKDPDRAEVKAALDKALDAGSIGLKVLSAVDPLTPEAIGMVFEECNRQKAYVSIHCGSTETNSDITGFHEAVMLAGDLKLHIAHINTYCRGRIREDMTEAREAIDALIAHPNIRSESYLANINGNWAQCVNGIPRTLVTRNCLVLGGYEATEQGMEKAILDGWAMINVPYGGQSVLKVGKEAVEYWRSQDTVTGVSFNVNAPGPRYWLASAKRPDKSFVVDALSTDGGGFPRNFLISLGMPLIKFGALTWEEYVQKTSVNPAKILGFSNHGSLTVGNEANITAIDFENQKAEMTVSNGKIIMYKGMITGSGTRFVTTERGERAVRNAGLEPMVINVAETGFYKGL